MMEGKFMDILLQFCLLVVGFFMLGKGADWFVEGAASIATRFGIPQLVIGLTIVAMGTSTPEAAVSLAAALKGSADITIGNVVGSNIMNILVILGLSAAFTALKVAKSTIKIEIPFMVTITALLYVQGLDGVITLMDGALLAAVFVGYLLYLYIVTKQAGPVEDDEEVAGYPIGQAL
ncbi:MAG: sodium:calcium antiporter, partial [Phascolarctobacterium sp.]|nr:sodium:calcium antiporter [Phascolarctobacterium sp.]